MDPCYVFLQGQVEDYAWPMHSSGTGDKKEGAASEPGTDGGADQVASLDPGADGGADHVATPDPGADQGADQVASPDPDADGGADHVATPDPGADQGADQVASPDPGADGGADQVGTSDTRCDESSDEDSEEEVSVSLPPARKVWKGVPVKNEFPFFDPKEEESENWALATYRYKMHVSGDDTSNFTKKWRTAKYDKTQPLRPRDEVKMNKFFEAFFENWNWSSSEERQADLRKVRHQMKLSINHSCNPAEKRFFEKDNQQQLSFMKKERKKFRRALEFKWMFGDSAMVNGLKCNPMTNTFQARLVYSVKSGAGNTEEKEEIKTVLEDWIKDANYGEGVVQHLINLGLHSKFVEVPFGRRIFIHTKKVQV